MEELERSEQEYREYIAEHLNNVAEVWQDLKDAGYHIEMALLPYQITKIEVLVIEHDQSKYSREEFKTYRKNFFPVSLEEENPDKNGFKKAWNHHQKSNPHHWQYWLMWKNGNTEALEMDVVYVVEMLIDWTAMAYKFGDTPGEFYTKNKDNMLLHDKTRLCVELWLPLFTKLTEKKHSS